MALQVGDPTLTELEDATSDIDDAVALRRRIKDAGYLLLRGFHERDAVLTARRALLDKLAANGALDPRRPVMDAAINNQASPLAAYVPGGGGLTATPEFRAVVDGERIMSFFTDLIGHRAVTYDHKWMRFMPHGGASTPHCDHVFMGRGTENVFTCWTPLGDVPYDAAPLALWTGSEWHARVRDTYGQEDVDRDLIEGTIANDPAELVSAMGGEWKSTEFRAGDVLIFDMYTVHCSLTNTTDCYRLSSDTRYQSVLEPIDARWVGEKPVGHYAWLGSGSTMEPVMDGRRRWGLPVPA